MSGGVTLCVTSCGRAGLLARTLESLLPNNSFDEKLLIEDAADRQVLSYLAASGWGEGVIVNEQRLGQMGSIDRIYSAVTTPYIFHCEDDWLFDPVSFLPACLAVLEAEPMASCVCVRKLSDLPPIARKHMVNRKISGIAYAVIPRDAHPEWFGMSFNPGLSRLALWQRYGPYGQLGGEAGISLRMKQDGLGCVFLDPGVCHHIGGEAHVADPYQKARPKGMFGRLRRSITKRIDRIARRRASKS